MSRTIRRLVWMSKYGRKCIKSRRRPAFRWKVEVGLSAKKTPMDLSYIPIAAVRETHKSKRPEYSFGRNQ